MVPNVVSPYRLEYLAEVIDSFGEDLVRKIEEYSIVSMTAYEVGSVKLRAKELTLLPDSTEHLGMIS